MNSNLTTQCRELAIAVSQSAGELLRAYFVDLSKAGAESKQSASGYQGMVTKADLESEQLIVEAIKASFPDHQFLAEETLAQETQSAVQVDRWAREQEHLWIIDPLDGTNNFAHGISHYAVSIAYYQRGVPKVGVVTRPESNELFWAEAGQGAFAERDGVTRQAKVSQHQSLDECMVGVGFYYDRGDMMRSTLAAIERLFQQQIHGIRRMGTAALDIVQVATGSFGAFFEYELSPWDFAAARLFLEEAGGVVTTCNGEPLPLNKSSLLATNGHLHEQMLSQVKRSLA
ncbi:MAG: inositol monophosphatase family protein [Planctomycetota bacterium]